MSKPFSITVLSFYRCHQFDLNSTTNKKYVEPMQEQIDLLRTGPLAPVSIEFDSSIEVILSNNSMKFFDKYIVKSDTRVEKDGYLYLEGYENTVYSFLNYYEKNNFDCYYMRNDRFVFFTSNHSTCRQTFKKIGALPQRKNGKPTNHIFRFEEIDEDDYNFESLKAETNIRGTSFRINDSKITASSLSGRSRIDEDPLYKSYEDEGALKSSIRFEIRHDMKVYMCLLSINGTFVIYDKIAIKDALSLLKALLDLLKL